MVRHEGFYWVRWAYESDRLQVAEWADPYEEGLAWWIVGCETPVRDDHVIVLSDIITPPTTLGAQTYG